MLLTMTGLVLGAILGPMQALRRGGKRLDALHYGTAYAVIGALLGLFTTIILTRMSMG